MRLKTPMDVWNASDGEVDARETEWGYLEVKRRQDPDSMWVASRDVETSSCYGCGHAVLSAMDDDGTPRLYVPIEPPQ